MTVEFDLPNLEAMDRFGAALAGVLRTGDLVALWGGLGAGKTTLTRFMLSAMAGCPLDVPSPTYTLVQTYDLPPGQVFHFDLYRLNDPLELDELGWEDTDHGVALVEWPDKAGDRLPDWRLDVSLEIAGEGRRVRLEPRGEDWQSRLNGFDV